MMDGAEVVVIAHDNRLVSLYAHLKDRPLALAIKSGDIVQAGDRIGEPLDPLSTLGG